MQQTAIFSVKLVTWRSHSSRCNSFYLADIGDATYSSSDTDESVAFRLYRLEKGVRGQIVLITHMVSSCKEGGEKNGKDSKR